MSWNGTVRCSECYKKGHNRNGCPELKEAMQKRIEVDPEDWYAKSYFEKKQRQSTRTCGYCKRTGHNRKTCPEAKKDKQRFIEKNVKLRTEALNWLEEAGLGIGTLVKYSYWSRSSYETRQALGLVKNIRWDNIKAQVGRPDSTFSNSTISFLDCVPVDSLGESELSTHVTAALEIVSTIPSRLIAAQVPYGWLASTDEPTLKNIEETLKEDDMRYTRQYILGIDNF
jgi:hypothetical protein